MARLAEFAVTGTDPSTDPVLAKHAKWFSVFAVNYEFTAENALDILYHEIGNTFVRVLEDAGVYKRTADGLEGFTKFINYADGDVIDL